MSHVTETGGKLGFITPDDSQFLRKLQPCAFDLHRHTLHVPRTETTPPICAHRCRASEGNELLSAAIDEAIGRKPKGHDFVIDRTTRQPAVSRHMSVTGG
jgi:cyclic pyranopterin phosphate synthase